MNKDKISVIIPTYNREKFIIKSINSVLKQTYKNIEVIVIDDGSTDNTEKKISKIKDDRLIYIKLEGNKGACYARNVGIKKATGKYISFQDSDDIYRKDKLEKQHANLLKNNSDMDFCKISTMDANNRISIPTDETILSFQKNGLMNELCNGNFISTQAIFVKNDILKKELFDEELPRLQDYDLILRIIPSLKVSFTNEVLVDLYRKDDSISNSNKKLIDALGLILYKDYKLDTNLRKKFFNNLTNICFENIENRHAIEKKYKDDNINNLSVENGIMKDEIIRLNNEIKKLESKESESEKRFNELATKYNEIVNSKRWKLMNRLLKIMGK